MSNTASSATEKTILVIDDDPQFGKYLTKGFNGNGFKVMFAESGKEGLEYLKDHTPSYILTDIIMPDKEGIELILEIRKLGYENPIIAMSGHSAQSSSYLEAAKLLGATDSICKPFTVEDFQTLIGKMRE